MEKIYYSPEFEVVRLSLSDKICVIAVSKDESGQSSGFIDPGEEEEP